MPSRLAIARCQLKRPLQIDEAHVASPDVYQHLCVEAETGRQCQTLSARQTLLVLTSRPFEGTSDYSGSAGCAVDGPRRNSSATNGGSTWVWLANATTRRPVARSTTALKLAASAS